MEVNQSIALQVSDASHVAEIRRHSQTYASKAGFDDTQSGKLAIIATEASTNILKHAVEGQIVFQLIERGNVIGVEMLALDKGQGMADAEICMRDGYTTAGTQGSGLGAMARQSDEFGIYSNPQQGTIISSKLWSSSVKGQKNSMDFEGISIPLKGYDVCGDMWVRRLVGNIYYVLMCDGLGHGIPAAEAADNAKKTFLNRDIQSVASLMLDLHAGLRSTRGAAIAVAAINLDDNSIQYSGIGNIAASIIDGDTVKHLVSFNGTMGHSVHKFQSFNYNFPPHATLIMHSDGVNTRWSLKEYPGITRQVPSIISAVLYRDFRRERDDATVVTVRRSVA